VTEKLLLQPVALDRMRCISVGPVSAYWRRRRGLPGVVDNLQQQGRHGGSGEVSDKCKGRGWVGISIREGRDKFSLHSSKAL
jgi:hypothetical protein